MRTCFGVLFLACASHAASAALPLTFEENRGQSAPEVRFFAHGSPGVFFTRRETVIAFPSGDALRIQLEGAAASTPEALEPLPGRSNYLNREPAITGVRQYGRVRYASVYPGIDLAYYGHGRDLEYDFAVAAGAQPERIRLALRGASGLSIDAEGNLVARLRNAAFLERKPEAFQTSEDVLRSVEVHFVLTGKNEVAFAVGTYDHSRPLLIDPLIDYSTNLGAFGGSIVTGGDVAYGIAADAAGSAYVTGDAPSGQFPVTTGIGASGNNTGYVAKLSPDGAHVVYATYLNLPAGQAIAVDSQGSAYVTGWSSNLAYVVKLTPDGSALAYSYSLVPSLGFGESAPFRLVLDSAQNVYINGNTLDTQLPTTSGAFQTSFPGQVGLFGATTAYGFVIKLNAAGHLAYCTYLRVPFSFSANPAQFLAVDGSQNALVLTNVLPPSGGQPQSTLVRLNASGGASTTTFPNSSTPITPQSLNTDPAGNLYVTGVGSLAPNSQGILVAQISSSGAVLRGRYISQLGDVYADAAGNAFVVGITGTPCSQGCVPYVMRVDSSFSSDATFFLGNVSQDAATGLTDQIRAAALDPAGNLYLTLFNLVFGHSPQVPATPGAYQTSGGTFAVLKMDAAGLAGSASPTVIPSGVTNAARGFTGIIAPAEIVTVYGLNLGPTQLVAAGADSKGNFPTIVAGTRLLIGGQAVPLLYSSAGQIAGIAPVALAGDAMGLTTVQVEYQGQDSAVISLRVVPATPGLFGPNAIVNQNGSINSVANPAAPGSVVSFYCSGCGPTNPPGIDGAVATSIAWLAQPIGVAIGGQVATVTYAGSAPGLVNGVVQINATVPDGLSGDDLGVSVYFGAQPSLPISIAVH
jgi:uncharacterized protein (TIGR03437 family)